MKKLTLSELERRAEEDGLNIGIARTLFFAYKNGYPTDYFDTEYQNLIDLTDVVKPTKKAPSPSFIAEYLALFPTPSQMEQDDQRTTTYSITGNALEVIDRMHRFFKQIPKRLPALKGMATAEVEELILTVTSTYLKERQENGWLYVKKNHKFILDTNGSVLAECIEKYLEDQNKQAGTSEIERTFAI